MVDSSLLNVLGEKRLKMLSAPGYRFYRHGNWIAVYKPEFNQIWTNPYVPKRIINRALVEEFCHNNSCRSRPAQLHPVINWLSGEEKCPSSDEYRDLVEAIAIALYPLGKSRPVSKRCLPRAVPESHRKLANRIIDIAICFSKQADSTILPSDARQKALWAVVSFLNYVIPLRPDQGSKILDFIENLCFPGKWSNEHNVFNFLFAKTSDLVNSTKPTDLGFTITRPRDPHIIISSMFQVFDCSQSIPLVEPENRTEVLQSVFPVLLHGLTLDNSCIVPLYWLRVRKNTIYVVIEIWDETPSLLSSTEQNMPWVFDRNSVNPKTCGAKLLYYKAHKAVKKFTSHQKELNFCGLFCYMLDIMPKRVTQYLDFQTTRECECFYCNNTLYTAKTTHIAKRFISMPKYFVDECINAANKYESWLLDGCLGYIEKSLNLRSLLHPFQLSHNTIRIKKIFSPWLKVVSPDNFRIITEHQHFKK
jgi:hypothetical protein